MINIINRKSTESIEWVLQPHCAVSSEKFLFHDHECHLEFFLGSWSDKYYTPSSLYFKSNGKLQIPVKVFSVAISPEAQTSHGTTVHVQENSITCENQAIWSWSKSDFYLSGTLLIFKLNFFLNSPIDEKSGQTAHDIKTNFHEESASKNFPAVLNYGPDHGIFSVVPELTVDTVLEIYQFTDNHADSSLKKQCARYLTDHLSSENSAKILIMSDRHNDPDFKKYVMEYVIKEKVPFNQETLADFCQNHQKLAAEVLCLLCRSLRVKKIDHK